MGPLGQIMEMLPGQMGQVARQVDPREAEDQLKQIEAALNAYNNKVRKGEDAVQEDLLFHLAIANASGNSTLNTFMLKITPEIITNFEKYHVCDANQAFMGIEEHQAVFDAIVKQDPTLAKAKMKEHFKALYQYCYHT
jgi:GntR family transcriptional repressor for pyruvate dehydrogenase complex